MITVIHEQVIPAMTTRSTFKLIELDLHFHGHPIVLKVPPDTCGEHAEYLEQAIMKRFREILPPFQGYRSL